MLKKITLFVVICLLTLAVSAQSVTDYSNSKSWYAILSDKPVDVLFFAPTSISDKDCSPGVHNMELNSDSQRRAMEYWLRAAGELFSESCNYYGVYYAQVTMESFGHPDFKSRFQTAMQDVQAAFDYYIKHINRGRPFILAGHSQGALCIFKLLQTGMSDSVFKRMVAAYPIGYPISQKEVDACPYIVPAKGVADVGVCVSYNSASAPGATSLKNSALCINPLNWRTDNTKSKPEMNLGSVTLDDNGKVVQEFSGKITTYVDKATGTLVVEGVDPAKYYKPYLGKYYFGVGNYHIQDLTLFFRNLQQNVRDRIAAFDAKNNRKK